MVLSNQGQAPETTFSTTITRPFAGLYVPETNGVALYQAKKKVEKSAKTWSAPVRYELTNPKYEKIVRW